MTEKTFIFLQGLPAPADFSGCPDVIAILPEILPNWPFDICSENSGTPAFFIVRPYDSGYIVNSPYFDKPKTFPDAVNTLCTFVAELAWEQIRAEPSLLCVHAAAVAINDRLLLIPNKRRAGKSTLIAALAARGHRVFTDDFLPLTTNAKGQICGISSGITPRLRLPLPAGFGAKGADFVGKHRGPSNPQYQYLKLDENALAHKDEMLPIGGIMILNRDDQHLVAMTIPDPAALLRSLIKQNFAREMKSGGILRSLEFLVSTTICRELSYANVDQTLDLIETTFAQWDRRIEIFDAESNASDFQAAEISTQSAKIIEFQPNDRLQQSNGVTMRDLGSNKFLSDQNGIAIHQLNETSAAIWQLLNEPTSLLELTQIFEQAFPDYNAVAMCNDIRKTLKQMSKAGLVKHAKENSHG